MSGDEQTRVTFTDVLRIREFRAMFGAQVLSLVGDNLAKVAVALLVFDRYHSALLTGLTYGLTFVPWLLGGPLLAALADRLPRRGVMIRCDVWRALLVALIAIPGIPLGFLLALVMLISLLEPAFRAARSALLPEVLNGPDKYAAAMNLSGLANTLSTAGGLALGGAVVAVTGVRVAVLLDAGTFVVSALVVALFVIPRQLERSEAPRLTRDLVEGFAYVLRQRRLLWLAGASALASCATMGAIAVAVPLTSAHGGDQLISGLLTAAPTAGVFTGVLVIGRLMPSRWAERLMLPLALATPALILPVWFNPSLEICAACFFFSGVCVSMSVTANRVFVQTVDAAFRGRAFGIAGAFVSGFQGLSAIGTGWVADHLDPARAVAITGAATLATILVLTLATRQWRSPTNGIPPNGSSTRPEPPMSNATRTVGDEEYPMAATERRAQLRVWALILSVAAAAALLALPTHSQPALVGEHVWLLWFVALFGLCSALPLRFVYRGAAMTAHLEAVPFVVGLFFLSPVALVSIRLATLAAVMAAHRRAPVKWAFNLVVTALSTEAAVLATRALLPDSAAIHLGSWVAAGAGEAVDTLVTVALFSVVVRVTTGSWQVKSAAGAGALSLTVGEVAALLGVTCAAAMQFDTGFSILVSVFVVLVIVGMRLYHRLSERHAALDRLYAIARDLRPMAADPSDVAPALEQLRRLLHADSLELAVLTTPDDTVTVTRVSEPRELDGGLSVRYEVVDRSVFRRQSAPRPVSGLLRRLKPVLGASGRPAVISVPVTADDRELAVLSARQPDSSPDRFSSGDERLLQAAASQLGVAIERGRLVASLRHAATRDSLTDLANLDSLRTFLSTVLEDGAGAVLLLLNLDRFHEVNDSLGHEAGDTVLAEVARRLQASPSQGGLAARLGADQFALAIPGQAGAEVARLAALAVKSRVDGSMRFDRVSADIRVTIGIARAPDHGSDATTLLRRAEMAMTAAKGSSSSIGEWEPSYEQDGSRRLLLLAGLRQAIGDGALDLHFQPKLALGSGEITGFEALARWTHPELGSISPAEFIPLAEASGLVSALTSWVLRESLQTCRAWHDMGKPVGVAVNISARSLDDPVLVGQVAAMLTACGLGPQWLTLEITESSVMENQVRALDILRQLRSLGVRLSIDDFGTGYSSLHQLRGLPVHEVKIDRSFVDSVDDGGVDRAVVRAIVDLCDSLGLTTVAEGVEKASQAVALESLGVPVVQGFFYSKPMPRDTATEWLASRPIRPMVRD